MEEVERFDCEDDEGNVYTVVARQRQVTYRPLGRPSETRGEAIDYVLDDGLDVTPLDGSEGQAFKILLGDKVIRRVLNHPN